MLYDLHMWAITIRPFHSFISNHVIQNGQKKKIQKKKRFVPDTVVYPGNTEKWNIFFFVFFFFKFLFIASGSGGPLARSLAYSQLEEPNKKGGGKKKNRNRKPLPDRRMELP